jgi:hypothetical protein
VIRTSRYSLALVENPAELTARTPVMTTPRYRQGRFASYAATRRESRSKQSLASNK